MKNLILLVFLSILMQLGWHSLVLAQATWPSAPPVDYDISGQISDFGDQSIQSLGLKLKALNHSLAKLTAGKEVSCHSISISLMEVRQGDVHFTGKLHCVQSLDSSSELNWEQIVPRIFKETGVWIEYLPPPGGGATISN